MTKTLAEPQLRAHSTTELYKLILWNDEYNEFDWVIACLVDICDHSLEQAEQSTLLTHHKGSCIIKIGNKAILKKMMLELLTRELFVTLEK